MGIKNFGKFLSTKYPSCIEPFWLKPEHKLAIDLTLFIHRFYHTDTTQTIDSIVERILQFDRRLFCEKKVYVVDGIHSHAKKHAHDRRKAAMESSMDKSNDLERKIQLLEEELGTFPADYTAITDPEEQEYYRVLVDAKLRLEADMDVYESRGMGINKRTMQDIVSMLALKLMVIHSECGEAEKYCAKLAKDKVVDYVVTEDLDTLCFGSPNVVRGITSATPTVIYLDKMLDAIKLTYVEFVDFCILSGCDFTMTPKGFGPATALKEFLKSSKKLEDINYTAKKWTLEEKTEFLAQVKDARSIFTEE